MLSKKLCVGIFTILLIGVAVPFCFLTDARHTFTANLVITGDDLGIEINASGPLFTVANMAPGYRDSAEIEVVNTGRHDFSYTISTVLNSGDQIMFTSLVVGIKDAQGNTRYEGRMSGLTEPLELGTVASGARANYTITVHFPEECGNEYQGKTADVSFVFSARSHDDVLPGAGAIFESPFSNHNFTLRMNSMVPVKFHLVKPDGSFDYQQHDVIFAIVGPDANGVPQEYVFSQANGDLKFDVDLEWPHYIALLSPFNYSFKVGGSYTATVKLGDTVFDTRDFRVDDAPGTSRSTVL